MKLRIAFDRSQVAKVKEVLEASGDIRQEPTASYFRSMDKKLAYGISEFEVPVSIISLDDPDDMALVGRLLKAGATLSVA